MRRFRPNRTLRQRVIAELALRRDTVETSASQQGLELGVGTAVVIERSPVLMPEPEPWAEAMFRLQARLQPYDDFAYDAVPDNERSELPDELPFELASRTTQADVDDDRRSLERALVQSLYLVVQDRHGWRFPEARLQDDDTLRNAALRAVEAECGNELYTYLMGNAPIGVWFHEFPEPRDTFYGLRQFFMKAIVVDPYKTGPVIAGAGISDYAWITTSEIPDYVGDADLAKLLSFMLK